MIFYLRPPTGRTTFDIARKAILARVIFLYNLTTQCINSEDYRQLLQSNQFVIQNSDFLSENSKYDQLAHFLLMYIVCRNDQLTDYFCRAEVELFKYRLETCGVVSDFCKQLKKLNHHRSQQYLKNDELICIMDQFRQIGLPIIAEISIFDMKNMNTNFQDYFLYLPFTCVLNLVRKRQVVLKKGIARVQVSKKNILALLAYSFKEIYWKNVKQLAKMTLWGQDSRFSDIYIQLKPFFRKICSFGGNPLKLSDQKRKILASDLNKMFQSFPPCMLNLHKQLLAKNRLKHHARIQYTLFLKELGLSWQENAKFWSCYYSKDCKPGLKCGCKHSWSTDHKKYLYNIRHLYGLEGGRKNYDAHNCQSIQEKVVNYGDDSGCPFRHFDEENLSKFLVDNYSNRFDKSDHNIFNSIVQLTNLKKYCSACSLLQNELKKSGPPFYNMNQENEMSKCDFFAASSSIIVERPSQFYFCLN